MNNMRLTMMAARKSRFFMGVAKKSLDQLADPHVNRHEADAPQAARHQAHPQQSRHQKIDVTPSRLADGLSPTS